MAKILIIDDEPSILESLEMFLGEKGHQVFKADTGETGSAIFLSEMPEVVILDIRLPDLNGLDVLSRIRERQDSSKVIMMTAYQDMETTIEAMKRGAYDYIHKPLDAELVEKTVNSALHVLQVDRETPLVKEAETLPRDKDVIIGKSDNMRRIFKMIGLVCQNRATVLMQGETGTGKELIARTIHRNCPFCHEPFVTLDCSASVETLLESELFGHEKGAFTGAVATKRGKIELAGKGTLFLDELGELPLRLQSKFLGFLQRREFTRVGGHELLQSRCRIIGATNRDLTAMVQKKGIQGGSLLSPSGGHHADSSASGAPLGHTGTRKTLSSKNQCRASDRGDQAPKRRHRPFHDAPLDRKRPGTGKLPGGGGGQSKGQCDPSGGYGSHSRHQQRPGFRWSVRLFPPLHGKGTYPEDPSPSGMEPYPCRSGHGNLAPHIAQQNQEIRYPRNIRLSRSHG